MSRTSSAIGLALTIVLFGLAAACDKAAPTVPSTPPTTPATTIRITSTGISPTSVQTALGARVLFINNDTRDHEIGSDPHPGHSDCPVLNQVGLLRPGEQRETGNFVIERTCGFHDHLNPTNATLKGFIVTK